MHLRMLQNPCALQVKPHRSRSRDRSRRASMRLRMLQNPYVLQVKTHRGRSRDRSRRASMHSRSFFKPLDFRSACIFSNAGKTSTCSNSAQDFHCRLSLGIPWPHAAEGRKRFTKGLEQKRQAYEHRCYTRSPDISRNVVQKSITNPHRSVVAPLPPAMADVDAVHVPILDAVGAFSP